MVNQPAAGDWRPSTAETVRARYIEQAQRLGYAPSLREFQALTGIPRSTAGRWLTPEIVGRYPRRSRVKGA